MPRTDLGKRSIRLILAFLGLLLLTNIIATIGRSQGAFDNTAINLYSALIPLTIIPAGLSGIAALFFGIMSIVKQKERAWLVYMSSLVGFFVLLFILGEFFFPH